MMNRSELKKFIVDNTSNTASRTAALYYYIDGLNKTHSAEKAGISRPAAQKIIKRLNKILEQNGWVFVSAILPGDKHEKIIDYIEKNGGNIEK